MLRRSARLLLLVAALAAVSAAAAGNAAAQAVQAPLLIDFCKSTAADATSVFGPDDPSDWVVSPSSQYASGLCPRFVVDFDVPTNASGGAHYEDKFEFVGAAYIGGNVSLAYGLSQAQCERYTGYLRVYRKAPIVYGGEFTAVGGGRTYGVWIPPSPNTFGGFCNIVKAPGYDDLPVFTPPLFGTTTYRVAAGATIYGVWQRVRVEARHFPIIY